MNADDEKNLRIELCRRWPKKFSKDDLEYWCKQLQAYQLEDVKDALTKFKNTSGFRPKPPEIIKLLPRIVAGEQQAAPERPFSEIVAEQMNVSREASPAEKLMRYWRSQWWQYKTNADARRASIDLAAKISAEREGVPEAEVRNKASFIEMLEMFNRQREGALNKSRVSCAACLVTEGVPMKQAADWADWIETSPDQFRQFLTNLHLEQVIDPFNERTVEHADMF